MIDHNLVGIAMVSLDLVVADDMIPFHPSWLGVIEFDLKIIFKGDRAPWAHFQRPMPPVLIEPKVFQSLKYLVALLRHGPDQSNLIPDNLCLEVIYCRGYRCARSNRWSLLTAFQTQNQKPRKNQKKQPT